MKVIMYCYLQKFGILDGALTYHNGLAWYDTPDIKKKDFVRIPSLDKDITQDIADKLTIGQIELGKVKINLGVKE